jgi:SpoVK/Ycf46/Vps4 family AAA+-type ATPase
MEFIRFLFVFRHISELDELINGRQMVGTLVSLFGAASGLDTRTVCNLLASRGPLFASGALIDAGMTDCSDFQLSAPLEEYLSGLSKTPFFEGCLQRDEGDRYPLETFTVAGQALCDLLSGPGPVHILLYGKPGTGKTEFARAAVAAAGRGAFFLRHDLEDANQSRLLSVTAGVTRTAHEDGVLVIDEADELLATSPFGIAGRNRGEKARMNDLLDGIPVKTIWITNRTGCIDDSTLRRFHYSIEFTDFSRKQRILLWHNRSRKHPFARILDASLIARLAADFPVDAGPIGTALDALPRLVRKTSGGRRRPRAELRAATENALRDLLSRHCRLAGVALRPRPNGRSETYDPAALVLDTNREQLVANLENWQVSMDALPNREQSGLALLFHGLPGTGKTAFAGHLAGVLGRELVVKRASDLLSCYVGETEHNISRAFHQAEEQRSLLLIDEADSFLNERAGARHSWEVSSVNEFLTQMEIFHGLLVCSTNLLDRIDAASLRRFHWKIKFLPLDGKGKTRLFTRFFPQAAARLGSRLAQDLAGCGALTPGDFHAVAERFRFGNVLPEPECLIRALSDESRIRETACGRKPVGFRPQA